jgi:hypothetical protein
MKNITLETFNIILKDCGLTKKEFSKISHIPYGTILNWGTSRGDKEKLSIPPWVEPFLNLYKEAKKPVEGKN